MKKFIVGVIVGLVAASTAQATWYSYSAGMHRIIELLESIDKKLPEREGAQNAPKGE